MKIALIGCGGWGQNHARTLHSLGVLGAVCDASEARLTAIKDKFPDVTTTDNLETILADPEIAGVVLATPSVTHADLALRALRAGKDVLVEKPMAMTVADGETLVSEANRLGRILMVGHVLEYHPAILKLRELIGRGELGRIYHIQSNRLNLGRIRTEENSLWSFAPHDIALILRLLGEFPDQVACHGGAYLNQQVADSTLTFLDFAGGASAQIYVSWLHPFKEHKLVVVGNRQMAVFNDVSPWESKLTLYPHQVDWIDGRIPVANKAESKVIPLEQEEPLVAECRHFIDSIKTRKAPLTDGGSGLKVLRVLAAAQKSLETRGVPQPTVATTLPARAFTAHPSAVVGKSAQIGEKTRIWHFSHVMDGAKIGRNCVLGQNVHVAKNVVIGNDVKIQNNVSVYEGVIIEDKVFCGPSMVFTNVFNPRSFIERKSEFRTTIVREGATLGANCTIVCGVEIGRYALVGAGAVVTRNVPDYALVVGSPARVAGWMCQCGVKLDFEQNQGACAACGEAYRRPSTHKTEKEMTQ